MDKKKGLKRIESLERQKELHKEKILKYENDKLYLIEYWEKQIAEFDKQIREEKRKLKN